jgi:LysR family transcriptional regulator, nitrogen assimilation regulatory protein
MELRQLQYFVSVARWRNFTQAAARMNIAQPALSRQIQRLEAELGAQLFERQSRGVRTTDAGDSLLEAAERILQDVEQLRQRIAIRGDEIHGSLRIAVPPATSEAFLPPLLEVFRSRHPHVTLHILSGFSADAFRWLMDGSADVAFIYNAPRNTRLRVTPLLMEPMVVISPPLRKRDPKPPRSYDIAGIADLPLILPSRQNSLRLLNEAAASRNGLQLNVIMESNSVGLTKFLVAQGLGHSVTTINVVHREAAAGNLRVTPIRSPDLGWTLSLIDHGDNRSPAVRAFETLTVEHVRHMVKSRTWKGDVRLL